MPTLPSPPPPVSIWELIPITSPAASISGPPELPGLIAASVWITLLIEKPLGAWIWRCSAETMPLVTVRSRPNGLPIATTGSPTWTFDELPERQRVQLARRRVDLEQRHVGGRVGADDLGARSSVSESPSLTSILFAPSTTWLLVRMWPSLSITKPEPVAVPPPPDSASPNGLSGDEVLLAGSVGLDEGDARPVLR